MNLDIRMPMGLMFSIVGAILVVYGLVTNGNPMYAHSLGTNINLWWGTVQLIFGVVMVIFARRAMRKESK
jgi:uncharacterized membrane protein HdeD (DUF308 family)